jgi:hypothetical protein
VHKLQSILKKLNYFKIKANNGEQSKQKKSKSLGGNGLKEPKKSHKSDIKLI